MEMFAHYAGRELAIDSQVYASESSTGHRNRAIGHMLRNFDILTGDPMPVVEPISSSVRSSAIAGISPPWLRRLPTGA